MTNMEQRARKLTDTVSEPIVEWNQESRDALCDALVTLQRCAVLEVVLPILKACAEEIRPCKACNTELAFLRTKNGKLAPYSMESGINHFGDCPQAEQFRKGKQA